MRIKCLIILLFIINSCSYTSVPMHIQAADEISNPYIAKAVKEHSLMVLGSGGRMMGEIDTISVSFVAKGDYDLQEARKHFLKIVEPFVTEIHNSEKLKPYLVHPNNPEKTAQISITYVTSTNKDPQPPKIAHIGLYNGQIVYAVSHDPLKALTTIYRENYIDALKYIYCD